MLFDALCAQYPQLPRPTELLALAKALTSKSTLHVLNAAVPVGTAVACDATYHFRCQLRKVYERPRLGTSRALSKATLALLIRRMGLQRKAALSLLTEVLIEAYQLDAAAEELLLEQHPEVAEAFEHVEQLAGKLPRIASVGRVSVNNFWLERVSA